MKVFDFINHASIRINYEGYSIVTDPWYISNAFGGWYQCPSPNKNDIWDLIEASGTLAVIVSHGHDDHCDDWFIKHHLQDNQFFCSKFATPGLERRLGSTLGVDTTPIGDGVQFGPFFIKQFVNPDFTEYDAVITIQTKEFVIIHANDNWHEWPEEMLDGIYNVVSKYEEENTFLLIQYGIADSFPVNYPNQTEEQARELIFERFNTYFNATNKNMFNLNVNHIYYYANQSRFTYSRNILDGQSLYDQAQQFLKQKQSSSTQLVPGMSVQIGHKTDFRGDVQQSLFDFCLSSLERFINKLYLQDVGQERFISLKLLTNPDDVDLDAICYVADIETWNRILTADLSLESIIIGGKGIIYRPNYNISHHHGFISKNAYLIQNLVKRSGLRFFQTNSLVN